MLRRMERRGEKMKIKRHQQLCNHLIKLSQKAATFMLLFAHLSALFVWLLVGRKSFHSRSPSDTCLLRAKRLFRVIISSCFAGAIKCNEIQIESSIYE